MNDSQREAVMHGEGPMLVLAGPGSGKTFTITNRISYLIEHYGVLPEHILVITFTKEAAQSMQQRFLSSQTRSLPVNFGTFHAIFYQIIRQSVPVGTGRLLTDSEKKKIITPILQDYRKQKDKSRPAEEMYEEAARFLSAVSFYKNTGSRERAAAMLQEPWRSGFPELLQRYEQSRKELGSLDFDDMLYGCLHLLRTDERILRRWQEQFRYFLIDEMQDINPMQFEIVRLLAGSRRNLFVVGDDDQSIYGFRGSEPSLMRRFLEEYPDCRQVLLRINYRSRPEVVRESLKVIGENKDRFAKKLTAARESVNPGAVTLRDFVSKEEEYGYLTKRLRDIGGEGLTPEDCAVLFRTNAQMQGFASFLTRAGIPFSMKEKGTCLYDHFIARDLTSYVRFACGDHSRRLFLRIMNKPSRWISREALQKEEVSFGELKEYYRRYAPPGRLQGILSQLDSLEAGLGRVASCCPYLGLLYLRRGMGYESYLRQLAGTDRDKLREWMEFLGLLTEEARAYHTYEEWLEHQERFREEMAGSIRKAGEGPGVRLMTAHASKGLEFGHVWIPDVNEGTYPHGRMPDDAAVEEERRMLYVAMTRAKETLELTYVTGTKERPRFPSRFLNPLL